MGGWSRHTALEESPGYTVIRKSAAHTATARVSPHVHSACTGYVLYAYLYCVYALVGGELMSIRVDLAGSKIAITFAKIAVLF